MFERYTETAREALVLAKFEADRRHAREVEPEHLLIGTLRADAALASRLGMADVEAARNEVLGAAPRLSRAAASGDLPLSIATKRSLAYTGEECERLAHKHIAPEHLILGLLREESRAAKFLRDRGITLEALRFRC